MGGCFSKKVIDSQEDIREALCDKNTRNIHHNALFEISESAMNSLFDTTTSFPEASAEDQLDAEYIQEVLKRALPIAEQLVIVLRTLRNTSR